MKRVFATNVYRCSKFFFCFFFPSFSAGDAAFPGILTTQFGLGTEPYFLFGSYQNSACGDLKRCCGCCLFIFASQSNSGSGCCGKWSDSFTRQRGWRFTDELTQITIMPTL